MSVPAELYRAVEGARKRKALTRSAAVQEALRSWLKSQAQIALVREYEAGYRRRPEGRGEIDAAMATVSGVFEDEDDW